MLNNLMFFIWFYPKHLIRQDIEETSYELLYIDCKIDCEKKGLSSKQYLFPTCYSQIEKVLKLIGVFHSEIET